MYTNNFIAGTPIRDTITGRQVGWVGSAGSVYTPGGYAGSMNSYSGTLNTYSNGRLYENRIDQQGQVYNHLNQPSSLKLGL